MKINKNNNDIGIDYIFDVGDYAKEEIRTYSIYGLDPIKGRNNTVIGEIILRGYNIKLDDIEEKLMKIFDNKEGVN